MESSRDGASKQPYVGWLRKVAGKHGARTVYRRGGGHFAASTGTCSKNQSRGYVARKSGWSNEVKLRLVMSAGFRKDRSSSFYNGSKKTLVILGEPERRMEKRRNRIRESRREFLEFFYLLLSYSCSIILFPTFSPPFIFDSFFFFFLLDRRYCIIYVWIKICEIKFQQWTRMREVYAHTRMHVSSLIKIIVFFERGLYLRLRIHRWSRLPGTDLECTHSISINEAGEEVEGRGRLARHTVKGHG